MRPHALAVRRLCWALLLVACGTETSEETAEMDAGSIPPPSAAPRIEQPPAIPRTERRIVHEAELSLVAEDPSAAADRLVEMADSLGGYASEVRAYRQEELMHYRLVLRVPAEHLDVAVEAAKDLSIRVENETLQAEDVTERTVDLDARLRTLIATEEELRALLGESRNRRSGAEEIMTIYRELTEIRTRIEAIQAQLETLEGRVSLATLTVGIAPEEGSAPLVGERWSPEATARSAIRSLVQAIQGVIDVAIYVAIVLLPLLAILAAPVLVVLYILRRRGRRRVG